MEDNVQIKKRFSLSTLVFAILFIVAISGAVYFYMQNRSLKNPNAGQEKQLEQTIAVVSKIMVLPTDETPTLATVSDPEKLRDQAFFAKAQKGDKVLIYSKSKKAILYSVSQNKILEVSPYSTNTTPGGN